MNLLNSNTLQSKNREIYQQIKNGLLNKEWKHGEKLSTYELAKQYNVSKTPVQDALKQLEYDGFVNIIPQVGCIVKTFIQEDIEEIFLLRISLEGLAASLAATKANEIDLLNLEKLIQQMEHFDANKNYSQYSLANREFHRVIIEAAQSPRLLSQILWLWDQADFINIHEHLIHQIIDNSIEKHKIIYQAIQNNMPQIAKTAMEEHLKECLQLISEFNRVAGDG